MKGKELIPVFVRMKNGQTTCICKQGNKKCDRVDCEQGMEKLFHKNCSDFPSTSVGCA